MTQPSNILLEQVIEPVVRTMGYELVAAMWSASGQHRRLRVYLDSEAGVGLADCTRLSPVISNSLDAAEADPEQPEVARLLASPYVLEVSSPGLDRPLCRLSHFRRYVGRRASVHTSAPVLAGAKQKNFHGTIADASPESARPEDDRRGVITLHDPDGGTDHLIPLHLIQRANLVYEDEE